MQKVHRISLSFLATAYKFILSPKKRKKKKKWFLDRERQRDRDSDRDRQRQRQRQGERESILCSSPHWEMCVDSLTVEELECEGRRGVFLIYSLEIPILLCKLETIAYTNLSREITGHQSPTSTYFRTCQKAKPKKLQVNLLSLVRAPCQKPLFVSRMSFTLALRGTDSRLPDVGEECCSHILPGGWDWLRPSLHIGSRQLLKPAFDQGAHQIPYENRREFPQLISPRIIVALVLCPAQCRHGMKGINQSSTLSSTSVKRPLAFFTEQVPWRWGIRLYKQRPILCPPFTSLHQIATSSPLFDPLLSVQQKTRSGLLNQQVPISEHWSASNEFPPPSLALTLRDLACLLPLDQQLKPSKRTTGQFLLAWGKD